MKYIVIVGILLNCSISTAQFSEHHALYGGIDLNYTTNKHFGINYNLNYIFKEKYSLQIGYSRYIRYASSEPEDFYSDEAGGVPPLPAVITYKEPIDQIRTGKILVGRIIKLNPKGSIRLNLMAGIGYTSFKKPENWERIPQELLDLDNLITPSSERLYDRNYTYTYNEHATVSIIINPKIEFPFTRFYGISLSPIVYFNKDETFVGIGLGHITGLLRKRTPKD